VPLIEVAPGDRPQIGHAPAAICVPLYGAHDAFKRCLRSLLRHTRRDVPIVITDDADPDPAARQWVRSLDDAGTLRHDVHWLRQDVNRGFPGNCNAAFAAIAPADVALVNSDCEVAAGWLDGLSSAAYADSNIASATALTNHGTIVSVPYRNRPQPSLPQGLDFEIAAARVRERSPRLHPRIPTIIGHCFYLRRSALDLVGDFDEGFAPGYGEEVDFSQRCIAVGLQHVVADDVLVLHEGGASLNEDGERHPAQLRHEEVLRARYPWYELAVEETASNPFSPLARSLASARRALVGLTVTVDGRILTPSLTGTQVHTLEFIGALWRLGAIGIRVVVPPDLGDYARSALAKMDGVELMTPEQALARAPSDIVHRPYQLTSPGDLELLASIGERIVVTHLDLIAFRNPSYFRAPREWTRFRRLTREALAFADVVSFCTAQGLRDALADGLVDERRARVVALGSDHRFAEARPEPRAPEGIDGLADAPFLLCLGTDFHHKNRTFALRVVDALRERHGWQGTLVLAGPRVAAGSSAGQEAGWLALHDGTAEHVVTLPAVTEQGKAWLMQHASAVLYPTTYEGFGFLPFEAAEAGLPCFFAATTSMTDTLPGVTAVVQPWDADATADVAIEYLRDERARQRLLAELRTAADNHSWERTARDTIAIYDEVVTMPASFSRVAARENLRLQEELRQSEAKRGEFEGRYWHLRNELGPTALSLVGPDGRLPDDVQRTLSALTRRSLTRGPLLATLRLARRLAGRAAS
jgi:glycosyltransferase involved in cell wall biosynthesis/GT2 family glycosyltransferase